MKLNAIGVVSKNFKKTVEFYNILGFEFPEFAENEQHLETTNLGHIKLMLDSYELIKDILKAEPVPSNHSTFAVEFDSASEVDSVANKIKERGFKVFMEPWDAFWGQRYAIVEDPDGYKVDLYASL